MNGFFSRIVNGFTYIWYFSISDLRFFKADMLIRTAKSYTDYTGGANFYLPMSGTVEEFEDAFDRQMAIRGHQVSPRRESADSSGDAPGRHFGPD